MLTDYLITSLVISIIAVTYIRILSFQPVLNWWFMIGLEYEKRWFYSIIWGCQLCLSGQIAMWTYLLSWIGWNVQLFPELQVADHSIFWMVFFISSTIFTTFIIGKIYDIINNFK